MGSMSKLAFLCSLLVATPWADEEIVAALDDDCAEGSCALGLLQKEATEDRGNRNWIRLVESQRCPSRGPIPCEKIGNTRHFKFPAGVFTLHRQVTVPANTIIEGVSNPNDASDKTRKPDYGSQTVFEATVGVSDHNACYCQNLERSWEPLSPRNPYHCQDLTNRQVRRLRPGFLMYSNTKVKNIAYQGKDTLRPSDNGALCGGGVFETPGCVHNQCLFPSLKTGDGRPVSNVRIENVRMNDYAGDPNLASQLAVWVAQTTDTGTPTRDVQVKNLVAMFLHADGINFHGFVQDALVDDSYIQNTGDDIYAVWGSHFDTRNIVFQNSVGVDAGRARQNHYGSCVAVYGAKEATFRDLTCYAPPQNHHDCYDNKNNGETCNGCLGIIKESFNADYRGSVFTFTNCKFYNLKRYEENGRQIYDLSNPYQGVLYTSCGGGHALALSMEDGKTLWVKKVCERISSDTYSMTATEDHLFFPCGERVPYGAPDVVLVSRKTGDLLWRFNVPKFTVNIAPCMLPDSVVFNDEAGGMYRLSLQDGSVMWYTAPFFGPGGATLGGVACGRDGKVFNGFATADMKSGGLSAFDLETGQRLWTKWVTAPVHTAPAVGKVHSHDREAVIFAMGNPTGAPLGPAVWTNGTVYAVDAQTGDFLWTFQPPAWYGASCAGSTVEQICMPDLFSGATISKDGTVYINWSAGGITYALRDLNKDGKCELHDPQEVSGFDLASGATGPPALAEQMLVVNTCHGPRVFKQSA